MNSGILLINKPINMTSNKVIQIIKRQLNLKKVGHAGTLDPLATGVLIVLVNQATKLSSYLLNEDKEYLVTMQFNTLTDSGDVTGNIVATDSKQVSESDLLAIIEAFPQQYYQTPPIYSAIKLQGKKLYEYARKNEAVPKIERLISIYNLELVNFNFPHATFKVKCSKGTYVRSLVVDLAAKLKTIATVSALERIASGRYDINHCKTLDVVNTNDLISINNILKNYMPAVTVNDELSIKQGKMITLNNISKKHVFLIDPNNRPLAIYKSQAENQYICDKGLWHEDN